MSHRASLIMLACVAASSAALGAETDALKTISAARGQALFEGREPLSGTIRGHTRSMPADAVICGGCHKSTPSGPGGLSQAPSLDVKGLLDQLPRRGGPPSAYTLDTFCRVVRTGVDPVYVLVSRTMPKFVVSAQQCESLWLYLMERK